MTMKTKKVCAFAAMAAAVVCTYSARALDLPGAGETYTVPSGVTNVITDAEIDAYNALGKVVFTDETSALRFTAGTAPNVLLEGSGWMIKDNDAEWSISCQQSTAWVGTWDFKDGTIKLVSPDGTANNHGALFNYSSPDLHDVYVREGANLYGFVDYKCCQAYNKVRFHLAGQIETRAGGYGPNIRQVFLDDDATWYNGTSTTPTFGYSGSYDGLLNLNGYMLTANGANYANSSFYMQGVTINGPGTFFVNQTVNGGLIVRSYSSESYDGFYKAAVGKKIGDGKSWLLVPPPSTPINNANFLSFVFGDEEQGETDGIKAVSTKVENGVRYNLAGQKVGADYKGIVIVNGKKFVVK